MKSLKEMMRRVGSGSKIVSLLEASITDNDAEIALALPAFLWKFHIDATALKDDGFELDR